MNSIVDLAGVAGAIAVSLALAIGLEWLSLRAVMHLMPGRPMAAPAPLSTQAARRTERRKAS